ncbi:hypothetical protein EDD96_5218 [Streptomyces sp. Ag109_G2-6]|nr:hypothetical protein EDD96_5218 [Streptomyces sp. Ag109_G2-6]
MTGVPAGRSQRGVGAFPSVSSSFRVGPPCQGRSFVASLRDRLRRPLIGRPATEKRRLPGNPQRNGTDVHWTYGGISDPSGSSGAASPSIRADRRVKRGRDSRQIATRSSRLSVRRPPAAAARRKGRQIRHPGPGGATNRYALLPFRRPAAVLGRCPHARATGSASGPGRRPRSLRAPRNPASGGRLGLIPAPNDDRMGIRAVGRARSLRAPRISAAAGRPGLLPAPEDDRESIPAQDGRRTPRKQERVAISGVWGARMSLSSAFGAGSDPRRAADAETGGARSDLPRLAGSDAEPVALACGQRPKTAAGRRDLGSA